MICFYHSADLDGKCSAAIVKKKYPDADLRPINYGDKFPWEDVKNQDVIMVDFSLQPFEEMLMLFGAAKSITWIDHHKSAIEDYNNWRKSLEREGRTSPTDHYTHCKVGKAACELVWEYYFPDEAMPRAVKLLGRYDVWDFDETKDHVLEFQYGMRQDDWWPDDPKWEPLLEELFLDSPLVWDKIKTGEIILSYVNQQNEIYAKAFSFETDFGDLSCVALNRALTNSKALECVFNPNRHDAMILFAWKPKIEAWNVSLYTTIDTVDVSKVAKAHGGGGHAKAAGFQAKELPFKLTGYRVPLGNVNV